MLSQKIRPLRRQNTDRKWASRSAVRSEGLLGRAAGFENLVEPLDLPAPRLPAQLFERVGARANRQVGAQLAIDSVAAGGHRSLWRVEDRER